MNHVILVGRLIDDPQFSNQDQTRMVIVLAVPRTYRNSDGIYETDFLRCVLWNGIAKKAGEYCKKGDIVCLKGRLQVRSYEEGEEKKFITEVIVDSLAFVCNANRIKKIGDENVNAEINDEAIEYTSIGEDNE